jgi:hypothetical protein
MVRGFTNENVPLHETINNIPYSEHRYSNNAKGEAQNLITVVNGQKPKSTTFATDGSVNVWNTELTLIRVGEADLKSAFVKPD